MNSFSTSCLRFAAFAWMRHCHYRRVFSTRVFAKAVAIFFQSQLQQTLPFSGIACRWVAAAHHSQVIRLAKQIAAGSYVLNQDRGILRVMILSASFTKHSSRIFEHT
jgi:hypothetical protein